MRDSEILMNPSDLVCFLKKGPEEFTKEDIIRFCEENRVEMVNFRYAAGDGKLKTLNFVISSKEHLDTILSDGERVDGSNLFSFIEAGSSDLYVIPRYRTAFMNPFAEVPTLEFLCSFYDSDGKPLESSPEYVLRKADEEFTRRTGCTFKTLGELEYYVISPREDLYPGRDQKGYHSADPFVKFADLRDEAMRLIVRAGGRVKYGHSEVGCFCNGDTYYEQHEIEFLPMPVEQAVEQLVIAKWILRMLGSRYGVEISFAPKITVGKAGSGMHFHMLVEKDGRNLVVEDGRLSPLARKMIAGILDAADALTAFGNSIPTSYLRLVPHQEAPTTICWGDRNRSVVVRVPLGWIGVDGMTLDANPCEDRCREERSSKQTFEYRVADGSADLYLTVAGLIVAALHGITMPGALEAAERLYVSGNIFRPEFKERLAEFNRLPASCVESAEALEAKRAIFEENRIFPAGMIDSRISTLKAFNDRGLSEKLYGNNEAIRELVEQFLHVA
ncbi:glutamine synthetase [Methanoculleus bourgensis]|uniref:glutamine synthetase family protein n=1 Tax=Methanoculleus bourgensis TaxID=83986 RepID=UPI0017CE97FF|nr:glutamine synthetase family protein [Methanoculleus bourgensis]MBT0732796.1 glutamine synthetase [Methanoculleus bourgensis]NMA89028.1 glutamine synthetase [Methanoculleus bourgensis]